jgi:hypothetical protein
MKLKNYLSLVSLIFLALAIAHAIRIMKQANVTVGDAVIPLWVSWVAIVVTGFLGYSGHKLRGK